MLAGVGYSQSSELSRTEQAELVSRCEAAVKEVKISRALIKQYGETLEAKEKELAAAVKRGEASSEQIALLETEAASLRSALVHERDALKSSQAAVDEYKTALSKVTKKKNFFKSLSKYAAAAAAVAFAIAVLK